MTSVSLTKISSKNQTYNLAPIEVVIPVVAQLFLKRLQGIWTESGTKFSSK